MMNSASGQDRESLPDRIRERLAAHERRTQIRRGFRHAAVLMPLFSKNDAWHLLLTRRTSDLPHHRGQIAFPGGSVENSENCVQTALREAREEVALDPSSVEVLGCHDDIWTPTGFVISPVVGILSTVEGLQANPAEVSRIFSVPLSYFGSEENADRQALMHEGVERTVYFYRYDGETIWGATALIIRNFLHFLGMIPGEDDIQAEA